MTSSHRDIAADYHRSACRQNDHEEEELRVLVKVAESEFAPMTGVVQAQTDAEDNNICSMDGVAYQEAISKVAVSQKAYEKAMAVGSKSNHRPQASSVVLRDESTKYEAMVTSHQQLHQPMDTTAASSIILDTSTGVSFSGVKKQMQSLNVTADGGDLQSNQSSLMKERTTANSKQQNIRQPLPLSSSSATATAAIAEARQQLSESSSSMPPHPANMQARDHEAKTLADQDAVSAAATDNQIKIYQNALLEVVQQNEDLLAQVKKLERQLAKAHEENEEKDRAIQELASVLDQQTNGMISAALNEM